MKKCYLPVFLIIFPHIASGQEPQVPNAGFENWETVIIYESPVNWTTSADAAESFIGTATRTEDAVAGDFALRLETLYNQALDEVMLGMAVYGDVTIDDTDGSINLEDIDLSGFQWDDRVDRIHFSARYDIMEGDAGLLWVGVFSGEDLIGGGMNRFRGSNGEWTDYDVEIGFLNPGNIDPDAIAIFFASSAFAFEFEPEEIVPAAGSFLLVDGVSFSYQGDEVEVSNGDFSQWDEYTREDPEGWISSNYELYRYPEQNVTRTTDAYSGNYAAQLETIEHAELGRIEGVLKTGGEYFINEGFPATGKPEFIGGAYKHSTISDPATLLFRTLNTGGTEITSVRYTLPEAEEYKRFVSWQISHPEDQDPGSIHIELGTGPTLGSTLYIDDIVFIPGWVINFVVVNQFNKPVESAISIEGVDPVLLGAPDSQSTGVDGFLSLKLPDGDYTYTLTPINEAYEGLSSVPFTVDGRNITVQAVVELPDDNIITFVDDDTDKVYFEGDYFEVIIENPVFQDGLTPVLREGIIESSGNFIQTSVLENIAVSDVEENRFSVSGFVSGGLNSGVIAFEIEVGDITKEAVKIVDMDLYSQGQESSFGMAIVGLQIPEGDIGVTPLLSEIDNLYDTEQNLLISKEDNGTIEFGRGLNIADSRSQLEDLQENINIEGNPAGNSWFAEINPLLLPFLADQPAVITLEGYENETYSIRKTEFGTVARSGSVKDENATASAETGDGNIVFSVEGFSRYSVVKELYQLTLLSDPEEGGVVSDLTNEAPYAPGTEIEILAEANAGYRFTGWTLGESVVSEEAAFTFEMPGNNVTLTAGFEHVLHEVTVIVETTGEEPISGAIITILSGETEIATIISGEDGKAETMLPSGEYNYTVTAGDYVETFGAFSVINADTSVTVTLIHVGIQPVGQDSRNLKVYPNPGDGLINVEYSGHTSFPVTLEVISISGNLVFVGEYQGAGVLSEIIDLRHAAKGVYLLRITENHESKTVKIIFR